MSCSGEKAVPIDPLDGLVPREEDSAKSSQPEPSFPTTHGDSLFRAALAPPKIPEFSPETLAAIKHLVAAADAAEKLYRVSRGQAAERLDRVLDAIAAAGSAVPSRLRQKIEPYTQRTRARQRAGLGPDCSSPGFIPGELAAAAEHALLSGQDLGLDSLDLFGVGATRLEKLERLLESIRPLVFSCEEAFEADPSLQAPRLALGEKAAEPSLRRLAALLESALVGVAPSMGAYLLAAADALKLGKPASEVLPAWAEAEGQLEAFVEWGRRADELCVLVAFRDDTATAMANGFVNKASAWEPSMPWLERLKRRGAQARGRKVVVADVIAGFCPKLARTRGVLAWPSAPMSQGTPGKLVYLKNVAQAIRTDTGPSTFCADRTLAVVAEAVGAPSGKPSHLLKVDPAALLGDQFLFVENLRRRLIALYLFLDRSLEKDPLFDVPDCAGGFVDEALAGPRGLACDVGIPDDEVLAGALIVGRLSSGGALPDKDPGAMERFSIADKVKAKEAISALLAETQRITASGDPFAAARLRDEASSVPLPARARPAETCVLLMPRIDLKRDTAKNLSGMEMTPEPDVSKL
jgi:hypothetical protein